MNGAQSEDDQLFNGLLPPPLPSTSGETAAAASSSEVTPGSPKQGDASGSELSARSDNSQYSFWPLRRSFSGNGLQLFHAAESEQNDDDGGQTVQTAQTMVRN